MPVCLVALIAASAASLGSGRNGHAVKVGSLSQRMYEFALELRRLAYTMPGGHEDPLIQLSERMARVAREQPTD